MRKMFDTHALLNYLNDMVSNIFDRIAEMIYDFKFEQDPMLAMVATLDKASTLQARY